MRSRIIGYPGAFDAGPSWNSAPDQGTSSYIANSARKPAPSRLKQAVESLIKSVKKTESPTYTQPEPEYVSELSFARQDIEDVKVFEERARAAGYGTLTTYCATTDKSQVRLNFVSLYHAGEPWSTWGLARIGNKVSVWSNLTGEDAGWFTTWSEALEDILLKPSHHCGGADEKASCPAV